MGLRHPALTYHGALQILGHHERSRIEKLDRLLGGVILGAGAAALTGNPLAGFTAIWGWVDQKNEATSLLRKVLDGISGRLMRLGGYERHQLIAAAHTTIVISAFFEALREHLGDDLYSRLELTDSERVALVTGSSRTPMATPSTGSTELQYRLRRRARASRRTSSTSWSG